MSIDQPFTKICTKNDFYVFVPVTLTFDLSFSYSCPLSYAIATRFEVSTAFRFRVNRSHETETDGQTDRRTGCNA